MTEFNTTKWDPLVEPGYVYLSADEYYLYVDKQVYEGEASGVGGTLYLPGQKWERKYPVPAPVVVTDASGDYTAAIASGTPFAKTYEPPVGIEAVERTPDKYRRRYDLTGYKSQTLTPTGYIPYEFVLDDHEYSLTYTGPDNDGFYIPVITINPSGAHIIVEYENPVASSLYTVPDLDMNPSHTVNTTEKFIVVTDTIPQPEIITMERRVTSNVPGPGESVIFDIIVNTRYGMPVQNYDVSLSDSPAGNGTLVSSGVTTAWDGTTTGVYVMGADLSSYPSAGVTITAVAGSATGTIGIEAGMLRG